MKDHPYAALAECPVCETDEDFQVFIPVDVYPYDRSIKDPPLKRWRCTECHTRLRLSALRNIVALVPKD